MVVVTLLIIIWTRKGSAIVDGVRKSQFSREVLEDELLRIAAGA